MTNKYDFGNILLKVAKGTVKVFEIYCKGGKFYMSRQARIKSELGIYLISVRSQFDVCFSSDDKVEFLEIMKKNKVSLLSYTLFNNSFVFVVKEDDRSIDMILRQNTIKFVKQYNKKNSRSGKVFAGRYTSYPAHKINDVWDFISNTYKMINIDKDNLNSFTDYFDNEYINSNFCLQYFPKKEDFYQVCIGLETGENNLKLSDEEIKNYIINTFKVQPFNIIKMPDTIIDKIINQVFKVTKASARQIARITSLPLRLLWHNAKNVKEKKSIESIDNKKSSKIKNPKLKTLTNKNMEKIVGVNNNGK